MQLFRMTVGRHGTDIRKTLPAAMTTDADPIEPEPSASGDPFPREAIRIRTYRDLEAFLRGFAQGHLNLLILLGGPGLGKSQKMRQAVGSTVCWLEGNASAFGIYRQLWEHRHQPVVLDDLDSLYADRDGVRLLKCLAQTDPVKTVAWHSEARAACNAMPSRAGSARVAGWPSSPIAGGPATPMWPPCKIAVT